MAALAHLLLPTIRGNDGVAEWLKRGSAKSVMLVHNIWPRSREERRRPVKAEIVGSQAHRGRHKPEASPNWDGSCLENSQVRKDIGVRVLAPPPFMGVRILSQDSRVSCIRPRTEPEHPAVTRKVDGAWYRSGLLSRRQPQGCGGSNPPPSAMRVPGCVWPHCKKRPGVPNGCTDGPC